MRGSAVSKAQPGTGRPPAKVGTRQDVLAHLAFGEEYNAACLDEDIPTFFERYTSRGASDINGFNVLGVTDLGWLDAGRAPGRVAGSLRGCTRTELRGLDGGDLTTGAGPYPARWQAWHLAVRARHPRRRHRRARIARRGCRPARRPAHGVRPLRPGRDAAEGHGRGRARWSTLRGPAVRTRCSTTPS